VAYSSQNRGYVARKAQPALGVQASGTDSKELRVVKGATNYEREVERVIEHRTDTVASLGGYGWSRTSGSYETEFSVDAIDLIEAVFRGTYQAPLLAAAPGNFTSLTTGSKTIVLVGASPITLGFRVGDIIRLANHSSAGNNDRNLLITALTATTITVDQNLIVDATADTTATIARPGSKLINPPSGSVVNRYFTVEENESEIDSSELFTDCVWNSLTFTMSPNGYLVASFGWIGTGQAEAKIGAASPFFASPVRREDFKFSTVDARLRLGSSALVDLVSFQLSIEVPARTVDAVVGSSSAPYSADVLLESMNVTVTFAGLRTDLEELVALAAGTSLSLWFSATGEDPAGVEDDDFLSVYVPNIKLGGVAKSELLRDPGPRIQTVTIPAELIGVDNRGGAYDQTMIKVQAGRAETLAILDLDLTDPATAARLTTTRASVGYADDFYGAWTSFAANTPRITNKGLLIEEARTNSLRNNSMQGAAAGTPGTAPTNWVLTASPFDAVTRTIVGVGVENGVDYIDIRYAGTVSTTRGGLTMINPEPVNFVAAASGQTWTGSQFMKLVAGTLDNVTIGHGCLEYSAASVYLAGAMTNLIVPTGTLKRYAVTRTLNQATTAFVAYTMLSVNWTIGLPVDFTLRIGWPQLELGSFPTSPIRTTSAAVGRAVDVVTASDFPHSKTAGTMVAEYDLPIDNPVSAFPGILTLDSDANNRINIYIATASDLRRWTVVTGGVTQGDLSSGAVYTYGTIGRSALAFALDDFAFSTDGAAVAVDPAGTLPAITAMRIGSLAPGGSNPINGFVRRATYYPVRLPNARIQELTDPAQASGAVLDVDFTSGVVPALTTIRASVGYAEDRGGTWSSFASNVPRITDKGLLVEEARTNSLRNSSNTGAIVGSPGTGPTLWVLGNSASVTISVVGTGVENGVEYTDFRFSGTSPGVETPAIYFDNSVTTIATVAGEIWNRSAFLAIVGGSPANIVNFVLFTHEYDAVPAILRTSTFAVVGLTSTLTRRDQTYTVGASGAYSRMGFYIGANGAVDVTIRLGWPQLELGGFATSPIRTTSAAVTRAGDRVLLTGIAGFIPGDGPVTMFAQVVPFGNFAANVATAVPVGWSRTVGFQDTQYLSIAAGTGVIGGNGVVGGVGSYSNGGVGNATTSRVKIAAAIATNDGILAANGVLSAADLVVIQSPGPASYFSFGSAPWSAGSYINGYVERAAVWLRRLSNLQLQTLTK
jgi:hypothetical protein